MQNKVKLSRLQKKVIKDLKGDCVLVTGSSMKGAIVSGKESEYRISNLTFWNLVNLGLIFQDMRDNFNYNLTPLGRTIKID